MDCKWYWLAKQKRVRFCELVFRGVDGIWTRDEGFADPCLTTWPRRHLHNEDCWLNYFQSAILHVWAGDGIRTHDLLLGKETYYHCTTPAEYRPAYCDRECRDPGSNWGHRDFQSRALPTELSRRSVLLLSVRDFTRSYMYLSRKVTSNMYFYL